MKLQKLAGSTSEIWQVFVRDSSSTTGGGLTGLVFNSAGLTCYYHRDTDTTATSVTLQTMTVGTYTTRGFKEIDATNMPGWYQLCPETAWLASGAKSVGIHLKGATNMAPLPIEVQLTATNVDSATAFMTSVATATNVTTVNGLAANVITAAATAADFGAEMATAVWTDTTAGDFTTALSVGKSVMNGVSLGTGLTVNAVTGLTAANLDTTVSSRMATYTQPTGFLAATFPATVASTTNITAGTITTATNLTTNNDKTGYALTAVTGLGNQTANITGNLSGSVNSVTSNVNADVVKLNGDATAAAVLAILNGTTIVYSGTVTGAATTTTLIDSGLTQADTDWWKGRIIIFKSVIALQATDITGFDPATDKLTFTACTQAPTGATYVII